MTVRGYQTVYGVRVKKLLYVYILHNVQNIYYIYENISKKKFHNNKSDGLTM